MSISPITLEHLEKPEELEQPGRKTRSEKQVRLIRAKYRTRESGSTRSAQFPKPAKISKITCKARFGHLTVLEQTDERKNRYVGAVDAIAEMIARRQAAN